MDTVRQDRLSRRKCVKELVELLKSGSAQKQDRCKIDTHQYYE